MKDSPIIGNWVLKHLLVQRRKTLQPVSSMNGVFIYTGISHAKESEASSWDYVQKIANNLKHILVKFYLVKFYLAGYASPSLRLLSLCKKNCDGNRLCFLLEQLQKLCKMY